MDCDPDSRFDCSIPDITVGKTYAVATKLEKNKEHSWYINFEELND